MKFAIIIPTFNEEGHVENTIRLLQKTLSQFLQHQFMLIVFDSYSTDNTVELVKSLQPLFNNLILLTEEKKSGLGSAYVKAMQYVMTHLDTDFIFEFDADGSHQPQHIPQMLAAIEQGADVVMGSRYVQGGKIDTEWAWHRHFISRVGNWVARFFLTWKFKDLTTGYRVTRTTLLKKISLDHLLSKNYAYKLHLLWELYQLGSRIQEIPIIFVDRKHGVSKFPKNNILESLRVVTILRCRTLRNKLNAKLSPLFGKEN